MQHLQVAKPDLQVLYGQMASIVELLANMSAFLGSVCLPIQTRQSCANKCTDLCSYYYSCHQNVVCEGVWRGGGGGGCLQCCFSSNNHVFSFKTLTLHVSWGGRAEMQALPLCNLLTSATDILLHTYNKLMTVESLQSLSTWISITCTSTSVYATVGTSQTMELS